MNTKHYVSQDVAKMLKEKGFNESCIVLWDEVFKELIPASSICSYKNQNHPNGYCSAPSLLEAMDWLEERGIRIELHWTKETGWWYMIIECAPGHIVNFADSTYFIDRNECMNAAIKKGLELL